MPLLLTICGFVAISFKDGRHIFDAHCLIKIQAVILTIQPAILYAN